MCLPSLVFVFSWVLLRAAEAKVILNVYMMLAKNKSGVIVSLSQTKTTNSKALLLLSIDSLFGQVLKMFFSFWLLHRINVIVSFVQVYDG